MPPRLTRTQQCLAPRQRAGTGQRRQPRGFTQAIEPAREGVDHGVTGERGAVGRELAWDGGWHGWSRKLDWLGVATTSAPGQGLVTHCVGAPLPI